jgi:hypothetical protein
MISNGASNLGLEGEGVFIATASYLPIGDKDSNFRKFQKPFSDIFGNQQKAISFDQNFSNIPKKFRNYFSKLLQYFQSFRKLQISAQIQQKKEFQKF